MFTRLPPVAIAFLAIQGLAAGWLCYEASHAFGLAAGCEARLGATQRTETQTADLDAQLGKREAALDAAEAQLNGANPQSGAKP